MDFEATPEVTAYGFNSPVGDRGKLVAALEL